MKYAVAEISDQTFVFLTEQGGTTTKHPEAMLWDDVNLAGRALVAAAVDQAIFLKNGGHPDYPLALSDDRITAYATARWSKPSMTRRSSEAARTRGDGAATRATDHSAAMPTGKRGAAMSTADDYAYLCRCWPVQHVNGATKHVAEWTGWGRGETVLRMAAMEREGLVKCWRPDGRQPDLEFWGRPKDASGILPIEDEELALYGMTHAVRDGQHVKYHGPPPDFVRQAMAFRGLSARGWALEWLGPDPRESKP